jgi:tRNA modification GTPase
MNTLSGWDDTIVAQATPPGLGAIGILRLSGKMAFPIVNQLFPSRDLMAASSHSLHVGYLKDGDQVLDEVVVSLFKGPASYTGEDVVEISCHGSNHILEEVLNACVRRGARVAWPGEFTQRAFLNGKMDLVKAEAVGDLIASTTAAARKAALHNMRGGFSEDLRHMREQLIKFSALVELELDFATEDVEFADRSQLQSLVEEITAMASRLADSFKLGNVIRNGISVAIIGKPNAGKSTLLNCLLNENRAIVSATAGTTRDTIEECININGLLFRLIDTAGIRAHTTDEIEKIGMEKSMEKMKTADIVLYIFDVNTETKEELEIRMAEFRDSHIRYMLVANKSDDAVARVEMAGLSDTVHYISAKNNTGVDALKESLFHVFVSGDIPTDSTIVTSAVHFDALQKILQSLADVKRGLADRIPGDLLAADIRQCLFHIGNLTGEVSNEDRLDYIFSKFCIGK